MTQSNIEISGLSGEQLGYVLALALGAGPGISCHNTVDITTTDAEHIGIATSPIWCGFFGHGSVGFAPWRDWKQAAPLIGRYMIQWQRLAPDVYGCTVMERQYYNFAWGRDPLEAFCRALLALKIGDTELVIPEAIRLLSGSASETPVAPGSEG